MTVEAAMTETEVLPGDVRRSQSDIRSLSEMEAMGLDLGITVYQMLGRMPFLDRLELSYLYGISATTCYRYLELMEKAGFVRWFNHCTRHLRSSRRYYLTRRGVRLLRSIGGRVLRTSIR